MSDLEIVWTKVDEAPGLATFSLLPIVQAFVGAAGVSVTLKDQGRATLDKFETAAQRYPEISECYLIAGPADYVLRVVYRDSADFERIHTKVLTQLPGVMRVQSALTLRTVKRTTALPI